MGERGVMKIKYGWIAAVAIIFPLLPTLAAPPKVEELLPYSVAFRKMTVTSSQLEPVFLLGAGDVDGDGSADIVYAHHGNVIVLLGGEEADVAWSFSGEARGGMLTDLDDDGDPDLVVLIRNAEGPRLHLLENDAGSLRERWTADLDFEPGGIWAGDWDGDGRAELLLSQRQGDRVTILQIRGLGGWEFQGPEAHLEVPPGPVRVVGNTLILIGSRGLQLFDVRSGERREIVLEEVPEYGIYELYPVDLDRDGLPELVLATAAGVLVLPGEEGGWGDPREVWSGAVPDVLVGDYTGDGYPDLLVRQGGSGVWALLVNSHGELMGPAGEIFLPSPGKAFPVDLDGNGTTDLVLDYLYEIQALLSDGRSEGESWLPMGGSALISVGDISGDGRAELLAWGRDGFEVHWNNGRGGFIRERFAPGLGIAPLAARIQGGRIFVLGVDEEVVGMAIEMSLRGEVVFQRELVPSPAPGFAVSDLDGDGELDLLGLGSREIRVLWGLRKLKVYRWRKGELSFAAAAGGEVYLVSTGKYAEAYRVSFPRRALRVKGPLLRLESVPLAMGVGELDGDGIPDVVLACLRFFREGDVINKGMELGLVLSRLGMKVLVPELPAGEVPLPLAGLAVGDFDGDGRGDLAISTASGSGAYLLFGDGEGNFLPRVSAGPAGEVYPVLGKAGPVFAADLDGDGRDELVASTVGLGPFIKILWGGGGG